MLSDTMLWQVVWDWDHEEEGTEDVPNYTADFETTVDSDDCRVWAWATCRIGSYDNKQFGNDIAGFVKWCALHSGSTVYFHNLKFDGKFIVHHLLSSNWRWVNCDDEAAPNTFQTLISDTNQWYSLKLWFPDGRCVEILDSLKVIPLPVAAIPDAFGLDMRKLDLDYVASREIGHLLTDEEKEYISHDVEIVARALAVMHDQGMKRMTAGSNAFADYVKTIGGKKRMRDWFPEPDYDYDIRESGCYKGGFTGANPMFQNMIQGEGCSFDVNSLYPSVMFSAHGEVLPFGEPIKYMGKYSYDEDYPLYIQFIEADFSVKPGHIPCIQLKGNSMFGATEYITDTKGSTPLCLTSVDLELLFQFYDVHDIRYVRGYKFRGSTELFKDYVAKWTAVKTQASDEGNEGMRTIAKLELNSLYGKFATNPVKQSRRPYLDDDGIVRYELLEPEFKEPVYLPVGAFITSYARAFTLRAAQANIERWLYSDTDSCYFLGKEPPVGMFVHETSLGAWKREHVFDRFKVLGAKAYCFEEDGKLTVHCAGMPKRCHGNVTMENFEYGAEFDGKLMPRDVEGGIILVDSTYKIHDRR